MVNRQSRSDDRPKYERGISAGIERHLLATPGRRDDTDTPPPWERREIQEAIKSLNDEQGETLGGTRSIGYGVGVLLICLIVHGVAAYIAGGASSWQGWSNFETISMYRLIIYSPLETSGAISILLSALGIQVSLVVVTSLQESRYFNYDPWQEGNRWALHLLQANLGLALSFISGYCLVLEAHYSILSALHSRAHESGIFPTMTFMFILWVAIVLMQMRGTAAAGVAADWREWELARQRLRESRQAFVARWDPPTRWRRWLSRVILHRGASIALFLIYVGIPIVPIFTPGGNLVPKIVLVGLFELLFLIWAGASRYLNTIGLPTSRTKASRFVDDSMSMVLLVCLGTILVVILVYYVFVLGWYWAALLGVQVATAPIVSLVHQRGESNARSRVMDRARAVDRRIARNQYEIEKYLQLTMHNESTNGVGGS